MLRRWKAKIKMYSGKIETVLLLADNESNALKRATQKIKRKYPDQTSRMRILDIKEV